MPKVIRSDVRKIILKIKEFFSQEKENGGPIIPFQKVHERVSAATGISLHTVSNIVKEGKSNQVVTPGKNRKTRKDKFIMDSFDQGVLRRKIHEYYSIKKEIPTLRKLHQDLKEEIDFKGSKEILRRNVKMIGFNYRKTKSNRKVLMERNDISAWRARYLQAVKRNEEIEKLPIVYLDETYIHTGITRGKCWQDDKTDGVLEPVSKGQRFIIVHAGGEKGFVQNAELIFKSQTKSGDYHDDMNHVNFKKWVTEKLAPNLMEPSLIIMDNAPYHNTCQNKAPNTNSNKGEIMEWLREKRIEFSPEMTRPQLLEMVKRNKSEPVYAVDDILKELGHKVLRLPPYHCDLNPIEMVWASMKRKVAEVNIGKPPNAIPEMVKNALKTITPSEWKNHCTHVKKIEEEYRHKDGYLDKPFIVPVVSDSEESSDEDDEDETNENYMEGVCPLDVVKIDHNYNKMI